MSDSPALTEVESYGVERIPDADRGATPFDLFRVAFGGANTFATCVLGAFPILFGLSFWQGLAATLLGVVGGSLILAPLAVFGPCNGTNNAVSSSAHLGVHGRIVGSFLSLLTAIAFFSISVWSSGDALVGGAHRLMDVPQNDGVFALAYGVFGALVLTVCVYGFRFMLFVNKIAVVAASTLFVLGFFAFVGDFDPGYQGSFPSASTAGFWPAFIGSALIVLSNPVSFGAFLGDWARYIPADTSRRKVVTAAFASQIATILPFFFGLATASIIAKKAAPYMDAEAPNYVGGLLAISPGWYFLPVCACSPSSAACPPVPPRSTGTGLDFSSVFTRFSRVQATLFVGVLSIGFIFLGRFAANLSQSISTFATLIITCTAPWMIIMVLGYVTRRGWYDPDSLQGVQPAPARRPLLVPPRLELARHGRLADRGGARPAVRQRPRPVRRAARRSGRRRGHLAAGGPRHRLAPLSGAAVALPRAARGVRARGAAAGPRLGRARTADHHGGRCARARDGGRSVRPPCASSTSPYP